jgi:Na+-driven multidrug efflux pump
VSAGALKGAGDTRFPAIAQIVFAWLFFLPLVFVLGNPRVGGLRGAWAAATIYIWVYDLVLLWRFVGERWRKINIFE